MFLERSKWYKLISLKVYGREEKEFKLALCFNISYN